MTEPLQINNVCFYIAPIGEDGSEIRKRSDQVLKYIVAPAAQNCGYNVLRADQLSEPGNITSQVIQHILEDPIVIADLTGRNANVFYELAIRHVIRKPYVQIIQRGETLPFDIAGVRTIPVDHHEFDIATAAREEIERQIKAAIKAKTVESPVSVAANVESLGRSDKSTDRQLADILVALSDLKQVVQVQPENANEYAMRTTLRAIETTSQKVLNVVDLLKQLALVTSSLVSAQAADDLKIREVKPTGHLRLKRDITQWTGTPEGMPIYSSRSQIGIGRGLIKLAQKGDLVTVLEGLCAHSSEGSFKVEWHDVEPISFSTEMVNPVLESPSPLRGKSKVKNQKLS